MCPKVELEEKKWGESEWKIEVWRGGKKWKEEREFSLRKRMPQNQSTIQDSNFDWDHERR